MRKLFAAAAVVCALLAVAGASAATGHEHGARAKQGASDGGTPPISWGVADDSSKYANDGGSWFYGEMAGANLTENRWTLAWNPQDPTAITELAFLQRAAPVAQARGIHVVLVLYSGTNGTSSPDARDHDATGFCNWAGIVADTVQQWGIHDYVVLNEPNTALYWAPQKDAAGNDVAAAPVEALLAKCYDTLHAHDANANVIGLGLSPRASTEKSSNDPLSFLRDIGTAYKASGRTTPIMDQLALHPYPRPDVKGSPPDAGWGSTGDAANRFSISQLDRVKQAVYDAFNGTGQPTTLNGLTFRLDEVGWQTDTSAYPQYFNSETWPQVITEQQQAQYLQETAQKYFACDPTVTDVELFLLVDEATRDGKSQDGSSVIGGGWQSGLLTAGGEGVSQPKAAYAAVGPILGQGRAACTDGIVTWTPGAAGGSGTTTATSSSGSTGSGSTGSGSTGSGGTSSTSSSFVSSADQLRSLFSSFQAGISAFFDQLRTSSFDSSASPQELYQQLGAQLKTTLLQLGQVFEQPLQNVDLGVLLLQLGPQQSGNLSTFASQIQSQLGSLLGGSFRATSAHGTARVTVVGRRKVAVKAGATPKLTLKLKKGKVAAGTYVLVVGARTADRSTSGYVAVKLATVAAKAPSKAAKAKQKKAIAACNKRFKGKKRAVRRKACIAHARHG